SAGRSGATGNSAGAVRSSECGRQADKVAPPFVGTVVEIRVIIGQALVGEVFDTGVQADPGAEGVVHIAVQQGVIRPVALGFGTILGTDVLGADTGADPVGGPPDERGVGAVPGTVGQAFVVGTVAGVQIGV